MSMALYELSDTQVKNLQLLLQRVDLKGSEALEYLLIVKALTPGQTDNVLDEKEKVDKLDKK